MPWSTNSGARNFNRLLFWSRGRRTPARISHHSDGPQKRLTRGETHFPPNLYPLRPSRFSLEYLLLSQRSALKAASSALTRTLHSHPHANLPDRTSNVRSHAHRSIKASAASIFIAGEFGRCVVTRSLADGDFHAHRPSVSTRQQVFWGLERFELATLARVSVHPASPARLTQDGPLAFF